MAKQTKKTEKPTLPPQEALYQAISLCRKAGALTMGFDAVEDACVKGKAWLVMTASDASAKTVQLKAALQRLFLLCLCQAGRVRAEVCAAAGLFAHRVDADLAAGRAHHPHQLLFGAAGHAADALAGRDLLLCHPISLLRHGAAAYSAVSSVLVSSALGSSSP